MDEDVRQFVLCIANEGCEDLEIRKIYEVLPDDDAAIDGYIRVVDETGEDYLYPSNCFYPVRIAQSVRESLLQAA